MAMDARAGCPVERLAFGAHMEIGTYGDLATLRWAPSKPWAADLLKCSVTYGAHVIDARYVYVFFINTKVNKPHHWYKLVFIYMCVCLLRASCHTPTWVPPVAASA